MKENYRHTSEILWVQFQATTEKPILQYSEPNEFVGFPMRIKVIFTLYCSLLRVQ